MLVYVCVCFREGVVYSSFVRIHKRNWEGWDEWMKLWVRLDSADSDRWAQSAAWKMDSRRSQSHSPYTDRHGDSSLVAEHRDGGENKIRCTHIRLSVSGGGVGKIPNSVSSWTVKKRKRRPGGPVTSEKCLWARFVKTCYFEGTMFTQRNTYWESDCAGRIWNCSLSFSIITIWLLSLTITDCTEQAAGCLSFHISE